MTEPTSRSTEQHAENFIKTDADLEEHQVNHEDSHAEQHNVEPLHEASCNAEPTGTKSVNMAESVNTNEAEPLAHTAPDSPSSDHQPSDGQSLENAAPVGLAPSLAARCFAGCAHAGWFVLLVLVLAQTALGLITRKLWLPSELELASALSAMRESGNWLFFVANGQAFSDLPPLYLWFLAGLAQLPGLPQSMEISQLLLGGTVLSTLLCVLATWLLARSTGCDLCTAFAAGCMVLISFTLSGFTLYASPTMLFISVLLLSVTCLYRGWIKERAPFWLLAGFVFAAVAVLVQSPLGMALPLVGSVFFLFWRGTFRRAGQRDGAMGFAVLLLILFGWLTYLTLTDAARPYLTAYIQIYVPTTLPNVQTLSLNWWIPLALLAFLARPWTLLLLVAPWERAHYFPVAFWKARREAPGMGWLWWTLIAGILALMFTVQPRFSTVLPLLPLIAIVGAGTLLRLSPMRSRIFFSIIGVIFVLMAMLTACIALTPYVLTWLPVGLFEELDVALAQSPCTAGLVPVLPLIQAVQGLFVVAGITFVMGIVLLKGTDKRAPAGALFVVVLCITVLVQPIVYLTEPSLMTHWTPVATTNSVASEPALVVDPLPTEETPSQATPVTPATPATPPVLSEPEVSMPDPAPIPEATSEGVVTTPDSTKSTLDTMPDSKPLPTHLPARISTDLSVRVPTTSPINN